MNRKKMDHSVEKIAGEQYEQDGRYKLTICLKRGSDPISPS
jgi:hypothetical protein